MEGGRRRRAGQDCGSRAAVQGIRTAEQGSRTAVLGSRAVADSSASTWDNLYKKLLTQVADQKLNGSDTLRRILIHPSSRCDPSILT